VRQCTCWGAATVGALAVLASCSIAAAQPPPPAPVPSPADNSSPAAPPQSDAPPKAATTGEGASNANESADKTLPWACKGLAELPCRKNKVCTWIIPKEVDKTGKVRSPYCRKLGPTKKKAKETGAEKTNGLVSPATPAPERKPTVPASGAPPQ
jgi:hypothetical protein